MGRYMLPPAAAVVDLVTTALGAFEPLVERAAAVFWNSPPA
ncbi:hypothetical protein [Mesorhizobium sp. B2-4-17]|nr:hypothetical protein [Mesorhizobium sp. B2-4-17]